VRYGNDFDYRARRDLHELREKLHDHRKTEHRNRRRRERKINELQDDLEFLALINRALLEVVLKAGLCDGDEFAALVEAIDAADGSADGGYDLDELKAEVGVAEEEVDKVQRFRETYAKSLEARRKRKRPR
jgi:hypothetical protein